MMFKRMVFLGSFLFIAALAANDDVDLKLNGDFRGAPLNAASAPGWSAAVDPADLAKPAGVSRILPTKDPKDFALEITADKVNSVAVSGFYPVSGKEIKLEAEASGKGKAAFVVFAYDAKKQLLAAERCSLPVTQKSAKLKQVFPIRQNAAFVRIGLSADAGSKVVFEDVDAEWKGVVNPPPAVKPVPVKPVAPAAKPAPAPVAKKAPAPAEKTLVKKDKKAADVKEPKKAEPVKIKNDKKTADGKNPKQAEAWKKAKQILNDDEFEHGKLKNPFRTELTIRGEIEFSITEERGAKRVWNVVDYDSSVIKVEIDHKKGGWFSSDRAKIEIEGLTRGQTTLVLSNGKEKMRVFCNVR